MLGTIAPVASSPDKIFRPGMSLTCVQQGRQALDRGTAERKSVDLAGPGWATLRPGN
jgi:hypothetical protein